jgi:hypothetical protein
MSDQTTGPADNPSLNLTGLSDRERQRLRLLARRYHVRQDTALRPLADVMFDLRMRHGAQLSMGQVFELLGDTVPR